MGNDPSKNGIMVKYHDQEWGVPVYEDRLLFEFIMLEGAQAGLSWYTVLRKRENYRGAFDNFDPELVGQPLWRIRPPRPLGRGHGQPALWNASGD